MFHELYEARNGAQYGLEVAFNADSYNAALRAAGLDGVVRASDVADAGPDGERAVRLEIAGQDGRGTTVVMRQRITGDEAMELRGSFASVEVRNEESGEGVDATQVVDDLIEIREQSMAGTTFVLGHELAHNLLDVMRRTGTLTPEREAALRERFATKDGAFDEEAFADAFGDRLSRAFVVGQRELAETPDNAVVRLLDALAGWVARIVEAVRRTRGGAVRTPTDAAGAVDALVRETPVGQEVEDGMRRSGVPVDEMKEVGGEQASAAAEDEGAQPEEAKAETSAPAEEEKSEPVPLRADRRRELLAKIVKRRGRKFSTEAVPDYDALARNGRDVTAEDFVTTFGMYEPYIMGDFHGIGDEYRKWRASGEYWRSVEGRAKKAVLLSQDIANGMYDAWLSLAKMFQIDPRTLGLGGLISPGMFTEKNSYGSFDRSSGNVNISLFSGGVPKDGDEQDAFHIQTLTRIRRGGLGSTAVHEWAHAFDYALAGGRDADWGNRLEGQSVDEALADNRRVRHPKNGALFGWTRTNAKNYFTDNITSDTVRPEARAAFERAWKRILETSYGKRQKNLPQEGEKRANDNETFSKSFEINKNWLDYFGQNSEIFARALEGVWSDFSDVEGWHYDRRNSPFMQIVYPTKEEAAELLGIFRELFSALEVGVNETTGRMTLFSTEAVGAPRFSETEAGRRVVARLVDNLIRHQEDLAFGNAAVEGALEQGGNAAVGKWNRVASAGANGAESLPDTAEGLAKEEKFRAFQFGRPGGEELRELVREAGSAENWLDVVGTAYEALSAVRAGNLLGGGLAEQIAKRYERSEREAVGWYVRRIVEARATDYGQKCYLMGREFAMQLMREANESALAELRSEYEDKLSAVRAERRDADEARRTAERGRDRARERLRRERARQRFIDADRDLLTRWLLAEAQNEVRATRERERAKAAEAVGEAKAQTREAKKAATAERNRADAAERALARERETSANVAWQLAEERLLSRYYEAKMKHLMEMRVRTLRDRMRETREQQALKDARKRALERERGMSFAELQGVLGFDLMARVEQAALSEEDVGVLAERIVREIDAGFDKETQQGRKELWEWGTYTGVAVPLRLTKQGERAYAMTAQHILKGLARKLAYGRKRVVA